MVEIAGEEATPAPLVAHLQRELGVWPPPADFTVTTTEARRQLSWDGRERPFMGVWTPEGTVVSVRDDLWEKADGATSLDDLARRLDGRVAKGIMRWTADPMPLEPLGDWIGFDDPVIPEWLHPFGGEVLVVIEDGRYIAGVGLKRHDDDVWEISVGTEEAARGRGLARRLVTTAAQAIIDAGRIPTYLHDPANHASAKVAEASGFHERGWRILFFVPTSSRRPETGGP